MSGYPDNFDGNLRPPVTDEAIRVARAKVALPATFLILNGLLGIIVISAIVGMHISNPTMTVEAMRQWVKTQPDTPERADLEKKLQDQEDAIKADPDTFKQNMIVNGLIGGAINGLAILGAVLLRFTNRRGWGYVSAIVSMIPAATGCCCTGMPFGLWGLIVLGVPSVAEGLDAARRKAANPNPDGY
jgi:hypothetical protein